MSTFTTNKTIEKPANGADVNTWDVPVNGNMDIIDTCLGSTTSINAVAASGTIALTTAQYRPSRIVISGLLTSNVNYQFPSGIGWSGTVWNNTTGAFTITISSAGLGASVIIPQGASVVISCDGTNVYFGNDAASGSTNQIQYNKNNVLAANANLTFNDSTNVLALNGTFQLTGATSGNITIKAAATSDNTDYTWPGTTGSAGSVLTDDGTGILSWAAIGTGVTSVSGGTTGLTPSSPTAGAIVLGGTLVPANGGTGQSSYTIGDIIYASGATTLAKLADVATGNVLRSGGIGVAPAWGKVTLTTDTTGILPIASGGTNAATAAAALTSLGAAKSGANSDITSLSALSTALSIAQGGTGATTAAGAFGNLVVVASNLAFPGFVKFENGVHLIWGSSSVTGGGATTTINYSVAGSITLSTGSIPVGNGGTIGDQNINPPFIVTGSPNTTGFQVACNGTATTFYWHAIGI